MNQGQRGVEACVCCESEGHTAEGCPWERETIPQSGGECGVGKGIYQRYGLPTL